uniref:Uncharacterized protein n=1 Tax=Aegilops tauschii subsp. strangulata TaxID=200361 RepID=A0A453MB35_AEGTS
MARPDEPASPVHSFAAFFSSPALARISAPSLPVTSRLMAASTPPLSSAPATSKPTLHTCSTYLAFPIWSPKCGRQSIGTPSQTLSVVEFQPPCVQNPATAACRSTSSCGAHSTTIPRPRVASSNPSGSRVSPSAATRPGRTTQRNGTPLPAMPQAVSTRSLADMHARLPKLTYSTDAAGRASSHFRHLRSCRSRLLSAAAAGENRWSGPMSNTGISRSRRSFTSSRRSSASKVLRMMPEDAFTASTTRSSSLHVRSWRLPSCIRSRTRYGGSSLTSVSSSDSATNQGQSIDPRDIRGNYATCLAQGGSLS